MVYHVDESVAGGIGGGGGGGAGSKSGSATAMDSITPGDGPNTEDPICCLAASEKMLLVGRESGVLQRYALPSLVFTNR